VLRLPIPFSNRLQRQILLLLAAGSLACAPVNRTGEEVHIGEESAIIIWDAASRTEHFIRRASFNTVAKDFGFLVPTPTTPTLDEADNGAFGYLASLTAPKVVWRWDSGGRPPPPAAAKSEEKNAEEKVNVIETKKIAGYDAAVLEASDASALDGWLKAHGYASSPQLVDWYKPYIAQRWKITAFKISKDGGGSRANASAVKMSFITDRPFFPYREPAAAAPNGADRYFPSRALRVFFFGDKRYDGSVGTTGGWPGKTAWSGIVENDSRAKLFKMLKLPDSASPSTLRLTEFEDISDPRPGTDDLFFSHSANQAMVSRPDIVRWISFVDLFVILIPALFAIGLLYFFWKMLAKIFRFARTR
jgi:hypothetical protein